MKFVYPWMLAHVALVPVMGALWVFLRARAEKSTTSISLPPGGNAYDDSRLEELVIRIADLEAEEEALRKESLGVSAELSTFLSALPDPNEMKVLLLRYVDLMTVEEIAEAMARSKTFVKNKHRSALAAARLLYRAESC